MDLCDELLPKLDVRLDASCDAKNDVLVVDMDAFLDSMRPSQEFHFNAGADEFIPLFVEQCDGGLEYDEDFEEFYAMDQDLADAANKVAKCGHSGPIKQLVWMCLHEIGYVDQWELLMLYCRMEVVSPKPDQS
jgi:hypothetical protein